MRYFEDFIVGTSEVYGAYHVEEAAMVAFAREFDAQPMHLDAASPQAKNVGGLIASGWHTCSLHMRMIADHFILNSSSMGAPGIDRVQWLRPVRAGDVLSGTMKVLDRRVSRSKPDRGRVNFHFEVKNQRGEAVFEQENAVLFALREPSKASIEGDGGRVPAPPEAENFPIVTTSERPLFVKDMREGMVFRFGDYTFTPETIIAFAREFDPQPFHLSEEMGKKTHFGGLTASGWHTASVWMKLVITFWQEHAKKGPLPKRGPGFGFTDLVWKKPVMAGDTLTYYSRVLEARPSASKPEWGIIKQRNYAFNQNAEPVFAFTGAVLWQYAADIS